MKKKICLLVTGLAILFMICNITRGQNNGILFKHLEAMAEGECGVYEEDDSSLKPSSAYCSEHRKTHEWTDCLHEDGKCCDTKLLKAKPMCIK